MKRGFQILWLWCLVTNLVVPLASLAADSKSTVTNRLFYRMAQLQEAKERAAAEEKPIAWISSYIKYLAPTTNLMGNGSHAATAYAFRALQKDTIIVFSDAEKENHSEPAIVDQALHSPDPHYTVPGVIILTPSLDKVICKAPFTQDSQERIRIYTDVLKQIRDKDSWREKSGSKQ